MDSPKTGRLVVLSGPSCAGKSPLIRALGRVYPAIGQSLQPLVLFNSRDPRPSEVDGVDYHFRPRRVVASLANDKRYAVLEVRGDLQAVDMEDLGRRLDRGDILFEGNPFVGRLLLTHEGLASVPRLSVFLSPISRDEILFLQSPDRHVALDDLVMDVMRRKLLRRTRRQKGELSLRDLENIEKRASSAPLEMREAFRFDHVIVNHDGEDSENWDAFYWPLGEARLALETFAALLEGRPAETEHWEAGLIR